MKHETTAGHATLAPRQALIALFGMVVVIGGYLFLTHFLGIRSAFAGLFLMFYVFALEGGEFSAFPKAFIGALGGLVNGASFAWPGPYTDIAGLLGLILVLVALYCLLTGAIPILFNQAYMLMLTVVCIPVVLLDADFVGMFAALAMSALYFGSILGCFSIIRQKKERQ